MITPQAKIMQVINAYPQLEDVLISYVPAFKKLENPVLRNTVAKVTTLQQIASIGNVKVGDLINILRNEVGQDLVEDGVDSIYKYSKPDWFDEVHIAQEFDSREMLSEGEQPVNQVMADLKDLGGREIYKLIAPFLPAPLIDKATSLQMDHWVKKEEDDLFIIFFYKQ